jgi:hypothetical protein
MTPVSWSIPAGRSACLAPAFDLPPDLVSNQKRPLLLPGPADGGMNHSVAFVRFPQNDRKFNASRPFEMLDIQSKILMFSTTATRVLFFELKTIISGK